MADQPDPKLDTDENEKDDASTADEQQDETPEEAEARKAKRWRLIRIIAIVVAVLALAWLLYWLIIGRNRVSTDNAYVGADTAQVTPLVAGPVRAVRVANTQPVRRGDILVVIDPTDARIMVARAEADLSQAERRYNQTRSTSGALDAQVAARVADIARAEAELIEADATLAKARIDLDRRQKLARSGAVSGDELTSATTAFAAARARQVVARAGIAQARANRAAASEQLAANVALSRGPRAQNPDIAAARTRLAAARLDLARTVIRAPIDGVVAQRMVQVGQRVAAGTPILSVVPTTRMYVDANFRENQLGKVRIGQPATLESDLYGGDADYHGRVVGIAGGTGSAFAIIPAQNATGNWIKVVQRLPVRIALDPRELRDHPLRVGLSMTATIDVSKR